jgi:glucose/arabinose dehydrogenase
MSRSYATYPFVLIAIVISPLFLIPANHTFAQPLVRDKNLTVNHLVQIPFKPSNMAFVGQNEILILDREAGKVYRILDNKLIPKPILDVNVATIGYRGMLGIDTSHTKENVTYIFLYYTEAAEKDGDDEIDGLTPLGNRLYRYQLEDGKLSNPKLLVDLPVNPGPRHTGGEVAVGPDNNIYFTVGDMDGTFKKPFETLAQNYNNVSTLDGRSGILRVTPNGKPVGSGILGNEYPLNIYFAYGIRNSFGMDWDRLTGYLWDTENGPHYGDEINLVKPGFNSGWVKVQGIWKPDFDTMGILSNNPTGLVNFGGRGKYSAPEFIWNSPVAPTGLKFFSSTAYGPVYENDLFVADANTGRIYHFDLNENRTELKLEGPLTDKIAQNMAEVKDVTFAEGFGRITDLQVGPDGNLYVLSSTDKGASIDRIVNVALK